MIKSLREVKNLVRRVAILKTRCVLDFHAKKLNEDCQETGIGSEPNARNRTWDWDYFSFTYSHAWSPQSKLSTVIHSDSEILAMLASPIVVGASTDGDINFEPCPIFTRRCSENTAIFCMFRMYPRALPNNKIPISLQALILDRYHWQPGIPQYGTKFI